MSDARELLVRELLSEFGALDPAQEQRVQAAREALGELASEARERHQAEARLGALVEGLFDLAAMRFDRPLKVVGDGSMLDAAICSINMLAEELAYFVEQRRRHEAELLEANRKLEQQISDRKATQVALEHSREQVFEAQKMEALGRLAGGIAHDLNNCLSVVVSYASLLKNELPATDRKHDYARQIDHAAERAADLIRQLLAFGRRQHLRPETVPLAALLQKVVALVPALVGERIEFFADIATGSRCVTIDPAQFELVLFNLFFNSKDAMPTGGRLTLVAAPEELKELEAGPLGLAPGKYLRVSVSDTGHGMDADTLSSAFDPFFTTKDVGKGTGLGLSTAFGFVKQSGGSIRPESQVGVGTTLDVFLPEELTEVPAPASRIPTPRPSRGGSERILLVEDQEQVRRVLMLTLERAGYEVVVAATPAEALEVCGPNQPVPALLLTDVMMPGMTGPELSARLTAQYPSIKVLFISGYSQDAIPLDGLASASLNFLAKPVLSSRLLETVRLLLDEPEAANEASS